MLTRRDGIVEPEIVLMGGGSGSFNLLQSLKYVTPNISAVVNMSDNGGSTGRLRDELGVLPVGDVRQCLVALSDDAVLLRDMFDHRFESRQGYEAFKGHSLGNIILAGMEQMADGDFGQAVKNASKLLNIRGSVIPVTLGNHNLAMDDAGQTEIGECKIDRHKIVDHDLVRVRLEPEAEANPEALAAISKADVVMIAPGNLFCSILPVLAVNGIRQALQETSATKIAVTNLMTKPEHTNGWHVVDYARELGKYAGRNTIDYILYNRGRPAPDLVKKYAAEGEEPVDIEPARFAEIGDAAVTFVPERLVAVNPYKQNSNDLIPRTLIRHNAKSVVEAALNIVDSNFHSWNAACHELVFTSH